MNSEKRKKVIFLIGSLIVAAMFLSSYGAFGSNNTAQATTTVAQKAATSARTYYLSNNYVNATIYAYYNASVVFNRSVSNSSIAAMLSTLSANGSISDYIGAGHSYKLYLSNMTVPSLKQALIVHNLSATITTTALIRLPSKIALYPGGLYQGGYAINGTFTDTSFSVITSNILPIGTKIPVHINALVFGNGTVDGSNVTCMYNGVECQ
ncbi:MAG: hypothetical protein ACP5UH_01065 [Candidatus Micrarchaeia archaeon]